MISNKTIIIDNNSNSLNQLSQLMKQNMPQLNLIGTFNSISDSLTFLQKEQAKLVFVNMYHLDADIFLQLQQMRKSNCSIIFITPATIKENVKHLPKQLMETIVTEKQRIRLKINDTTHFINLNDIVRIKAQGNYTLFYLNDRTKPVISSRTLKYYVEQIDNAQFIRPHQSHFVNRNFIENIFTRNGKYIVLKDGTEIKVSRRKARELSMI